MDAPIVETRRVVIQYTISTPLAPPPQPQQPADIEAAVLDVLRRVGLGRSSL